jgi:hypothetical protein
MYNFVISKFIKIIVVTKYKRTGIDKPYYIFYGVILTTGNISETYMYIYNKVCLLSTCRLFPYYINNMKFYQII